MLPPLITATLVFVLGNSSAWKRNAATATAPLGSASVWVFALRQSMASRISSSVTVTMSSTKARMCSKLIAPLLWVRRPSASVCETCSAGKDTMRPARRPAWGSEAKFGRDADHLYLGIPKRIAKLDGGGDSADQSTSADRDQHSFNAGQICITKVFEDFEPDRSLAGDDLFVVVGRHDHVAVLGGQLFGALAALFTAGTDGDDLRSEGGGGFELVPGSIAGHDDDGLHAERPRRVGHSLRMIAAGIGNNSAAALFLAKRCDLVISATQFESADGLKVFELEEKLALIRRARPFEQRSADSDAVQTRFSRANVVERDHRTTSECLFHRSFAN